MKYEELQRKFGLLPSRVHSPTSAPPNNLPPSLALLAPTFPTFSALVARVSQPPNETKRDGLFSALLRDPKILLQDLLVNPEKYEDGVASLVQELVSSNRGLDDLNSNEMELLDRATLDFSQVARRREVVPPSVQRAEAPKVERDTDTAAPSLNGMEPYWWLK
jgi:hypothetical protein